MIKNFLTHILFINVLVILIVVLFMEYVVSPVIPQSVYTFYIIALVIGLGLFNTSTSQNMQEFWAPIENLLVNDKLVVLRWVVMLAIPAVIAYYTGQSLMPSNQAPLELRVVHPAPPGEISFDGKTINLRDAVNPYREYKNNDPEKFEEHVELGRKVYYENCHFCHGDFLDGKGQFASALDPKPANFQDVGTIAQLQESYVFWRIAKGGPGLPNESMPWQTAMPGWEGILTENDIWDVTLFLYEATNHPPRTWE